MCAGLFYVVGQLSFGKQYNDFSEFFVGGGVIRKGTDRCSFNAASTCSICTFTPPVLIVLSFFCLECGIGSVRLSRLCHWSPVLFRKFRGVYHQGVFFTQTDLYALERCTSLKLQDRSVCVGQCDRFRSCRR